MLYHFGFWIACAQPVFLQTSSDAGIYQNTINNFFDLN